MFLKCPISEYWRQGPYLFSFSLPLVAEWKVLQNQRQDLGSRLLLNAYWLLLFLFFVFCYTMRRSSANWFANSSVNFKWSISRAPRTSCKNNLSYSLVLKQKLFFPALKYFNFYMSLWRFIAHSISKRSGSSRHSFINFQRSWWGEVLFVFSFFRSPYGLL